LVTYAAVSLDKSASRIPALEGLTFVLALFRFLRVQAKRSLGNGIAGRIVGRRVDAKPGGETFDKSVALTPS